MSYEKAEIPASEKFRAVKKLAPSTKLSRSMKMLMRFDSRFLIGRNGFPTCEKVVSLLSLAARISEPGFQQINSICKSQYAWNISIFYQDLSEWFLRGRALKNPRQ